MKITLHFYSWFRELTGCPKTDVELPDGMTIQDLHQRACELFPKLREVDRSTLIAVGLEYQGRDHILQDGDDVSFFPPVQGG